jgi:uncharacterized protein YaeQ
MALTATVHHVQIALSDVDRGVYEKGGISATDEPPIAVRDPTGALLAWIDVGSPAAERLHKATKAAKRVALYTHADLSLLQREASSHTIHKVEGIAVWRFDASFLDEIGAFFGKTTKLELVRSDERLYVTVDGRVIESPLPLARLV